MAYNYSRITTHEMKFVCDFNNKHTALETISDENNALSSENDLTHYIEDNVLPLMANNGWLIVTDRVAKTSGVNQGWNLVGYDGPTIYAILCPVCNPLHTYN